jgi:hypothetical protein
MPGGGLPAASVLYYSAFGNGKRKNHTVEQRFLALPSDKGRTTSPAGFCGTARAQHAHLPRTFDLFDLPMTRIFVSLALVNAALLTGAFGVGLASWLTGGADAGATIYLIHFVLGLSAAILTLLVHCLIFTYFLGTGRWVKEVGLAYHLPDEPLPKLTRELKRWTFPPALAAMLVTIAAAAAGAGVQLREWPWYAHGSLALTALVVNFAAFVIEYRNVRTNGEIIDKVLAEVERIRAERGLPTNVEELARDEV